MDNLEWKLQQAREIVRRLERISADSTWAHLSSGVRGALWRSIEQLERSLRGKARFGRKELADLDTLLDQAFEMMTSAAKEIPYKDENTPPGQ
ncbi:MAG TPA: hypothetical protein PJ988_08295 [Anaerolinea sp.]|nr:hypothetical protein [Anaerolinea sp.]